MNWCDYCGAETMRKCRKAMCVAMRDLDTPSGPEPAPTKREREQALADAGIDTYAEARGER